MIKNSEIQFTGISNLKLYKKQPYAIFGSYPKYNGEIGHGEKYVREIKLHTELNDDETGNHLSEYLQKIPNKFVNNENPQQLDLYIKQYKVKDEPERYSILYINGKEFTVNDNKKLPLLSFLAKIM